GFGTERIRDAIATQTGDSVFAAAYSYSHPSNTRPVMFHFDKQGNIVQQYYYLLPAATGGNYSGSFSKVVSKGTDSLVALGLLGSRSLLRVPMGLDGQPGRSLFYGGSNAGVGIRIYGYKTYGNQLLVYGYLQNESMGNGGDEGFLMSLDPDGNVLWAKMYGGSGDEEITDLQVTKDGFYMTGKTNSSSQGGWDVMLLKTDFNGDIAQMSPCFSIIPYTAFISTTSITPTRVNFSASNSGALSVLSSPALSLLPSNDIFDDNCNVLGWQSGKKIEQETIEEAVATQLRVFPNPFGERLHIELADPANQLDLALLDQFGRIVHQEKLRLAGDTKYEWSLPNLAAGVYVLQVHAYHEGQMQRYQKSLLHH
ncbi:MAG: T9SS type A sorting domain-containing protein, partial [Bacteroidia bacterium]